MVSRSCIFILFQVFFPSPLLFGVNPHFVLTWCMRNEFAVLIRIHVFHSLTPNLLAEYIHETEN